MAKADTEMVQTALVILLCHYFGTESGYKKNTGSFRSLKFSLTLMAASLTRLGFIVFAFGGQHLMQAQHRMHFSLSIKVLFAESMAPTGHASIQAPQCEHLSLVAIKSTIQVFVTPL